MRGRKPRELTVETDDLPALERVARAQSSPWFRVRRARTVLAAADGERKDWVRGCLHEGHIHAGGGVAVVGGGDTAAEEALFLTRYATQVSVIHRRDELRASKILQQRLFENPKVEVIWDTVVERVEADGHGLVTNLKIRDVNTSVVRDLAATGMFVFIGFRPNTGIIDEHFDHDPMGYVVTDAMMQTSIRGLFAAGDLRSQLTRQVTTAVGDATTAAIAVEKFLKARTEGGHDIDPFGSGGYAV